MRRSPTNHARSTFFATVLALLSALLIYGVALADGAAGPFPH